MAEPRSTRDWSWWLLLPTLPLLVIGLGGTRGAAREQLEAVSPDPLAYGLVVIAALSLLLRRRNPLAGLAICGAALITYLALGYPFGPILFTGPFAVYAVVERVELRRAITATIMFVVATTLSIMPRLLEHGDWLGLTVWFLAWSAISTAPAAVGAAVRTRRQSADEVKAEQARRAVSEERLRVAQEVHDGVGHGLAVIAMQAGVALHVLDRSPDRARDALEAIRDTSREALRGLRVELDHLRAPAGSPATRRPAPGLADVPALIERMRSAGADVTLEMSAVGELPGDVDLAAYRIVQESLTNVLRHAATASTMITVDRSPDQLMITVVDSGPRVGRPVPWGHPPLDLGARPPTEPGVEGGGSGINGMRDRAAALGGTLVAAPRGAGFAVHARLPINNGGGE